MRTNWEGLPDETEKGSLATQQMYNDDNAVFNKNPEHGYIICCRSTAIQNKSQMGRKIKWQLFMVKEDRLYRKANYKV